MPKTERVNCNFCKKDDSRVVYSEGELKLVECNICGFNYVNPRISVEELLKHYDEKHTVGVETARRKLKNASEGQQVVTDESKWTERERTALDRWLADDLRRIMKHKKTGRLLDVGCGDGVRLKIAHDHGWGDLYGLELSDSAIDKVKSKFGFSDSEDRFKNSTILESGFPDDFFDVVTYWSVLEHVVDPVENLKKAHSLLKKGGLIAIRVPNVREEFLRKYQNNLVKFVLPEKVKKLCGIRDLRPVKLRDIFDLTRGRSGVVGSLELELHVNHFNDRTLARFLESSGFKVLENGNGEEPFLLQEINIKVIAQAATRAFLKIPYYCTFSRRFNFSQQLFFIARKI